MSSSRRDRGATPAARDASPTAGSATAPKAASPEVRLPKHIGQAQSTTYGNRRVGEVQQGEQGSGGSLQQGVLLGALGDGAGDDDDDLGQAASVSGIGGNTSMNQSRSFAHESGLAGGALFNSSRANTHQSVEPEAGVRQTRLRTRQQSATPAPAASAVGRTRTRRQAAEAAAAQDLETPRTSRQTSVASETPSRTRREPRSRKVDRLPTIAQDDTHEEVDRSEVNRRQPRREAAPEVPRTVRQSEEKRPARTLSAQVNARVHDWFTSLKVLVADYWRYFFITMLVTMFLLTGVATLYSIGTSATPQTTYSPSGASTLHDLSGKIVKMADAESRPIRNHGWQHMGQSIRQFVPDILARPRIYLFNRDLHNLYKRLENLESDIVTMDRSTNVTLEGLQYVRDHLDDFVRVQKTEDGDYQLPARFWAATKRWVDKDLEYQRTAEFFRKVNEGLTHGTVFPEYFKKTFQDESFAQEFMDKNEASIQSIARREMKHGLHAGDYLPKDKIIELVQKEWVASRKSLEDDIRLANDNIKSLFDKLKKAAVDPDFHRAVKEIAEDVHRTAMRNSQITRLAYRGAEDTVSRSLNLPNYFSLKLKASIDKSHLAKPYQLSLWKRLSWASRAVARLTGTAPNNNPGEAALMPWQEWGDCYQMELSEYDAGKGLAVKTAYGVIPTEVVIENLPDSASIRPLTGPKEMDLLVHYTDARVRDEIRERIKTQLEPIEQDTVPEAMRDEWLRVASFDFDNDGSFAQVFKIQTPLQQWNSMTLNTHAQHYILRVRNNHSQGKLPFTCLYRARLLGQGLQETVPFGI